MEILFENVFTRDEEWAKAVTAQACKLQHTSNLYYTEPCALLAEALCQKTGMKKVFFSNSGAEANECAIKVARKYSAEKKGDEFYTIITLRNSFHGRTLTTLSATGQDVFHKLFNPLTPGFSHVTANDTAQLINAVESLKPAGIMLEMVQGEGGVIPLDKEFVMAAQSLATENNKFITNQIKYFLIDGKITAKVQDVIKEKKKNEFTFKY